MSQSIHDFSVTRQDGQIQALSDYRGKFLLVVNTASQCGFTPQYKGLETLWKKSRDRGLVILGFTCKQFGGLEPGSDAEIAAFCERNFGVTFPLFSKVEVNGPDAHPLFVWLKSGSKGFLGTQRIKWNFTKFLVDAQGRPVKRYAPTVEPGKLERDIERLLSA